MVEEETQLLTFALHPPHTRHAALGSPATHTVGKQKEADVYYRSCNEDGSYERPGKRERVEGWGDVGQWYKSGRDRSRMSQDAAA